MFFSCNGQICKLFTCFWTLILDVCHLGTTVVWCKRHIRWRWGGSSGGLLGQPEGTHHSEIHVHLPLNNDFDCHLMFSGERIWGLLSQLQTKVCGHLWLYLWACQNQPTYLYQPWTTQAYISQQTCKCTFYTFYYLFCTSFIFVCTSCTYCTVLV